MLYKAAESDVATFWEGRKWQQQICLLLHISSCAVSFWQLWWKTTKRTATVTWWRNAKEHPSSSFTCFIHTSVAKGQTCAQLDTNRWECPALYQSDPWRCAEWQEREWQVIISKLTLTSGIFSLIESIFLPWYSLGCPFAESCQVPTS